MKKKIKLFTTIASLCLAVALMAFGVYAATTATLLTSSTVSFTASNVFVQFDAEVTYDSTYVTYTAGETPGEGYVKGENKNTWTTTINPQTNAGAASSTTWNLGDYKFKETAADKAVVYTFKITNKGANPVKIAIENDVTPVTSGEAGTVAVTTSGDAASLAKNGVYTYTVTVTLKDATMDWAEKTIHPTFTVTKK